MLQQRQQAKLLLRIGGRLEHPHDGRGALFPRQTDAGGLQRVGHFALVRHGFQRVGQQFEVVKRHDFRQSGQCRVTDGRGDVGLRGNAHHVVGGGFGAALVDDLQESADVVRHGRLEHVLVARVQHFDQRLVHFLAGQGHGGFDHGLKYLRALCGFLLWGREVDGLKRLESV